MPFAIGPLIDRFSDLTDVNVASLADQDVFKWDVATGKFVHSSFVSSFNTRTGAVTLSSGDVTTALGFVPQTEGNYITALTGDASASGAGSVALTLATVNGSPGSFGGASQTLTATVNGKGLITALATTAIAIAQSQVADLVADLAAKQPQHATLTSLAALANASGVLTNDGAGALSWGAGGSGATTALDNLASVAVNTSLLPASTQSLGSATFPWLESFVGNTTQYESVTQTAGLITHTAAGSASVIDIVLAPKAGSVKIAVDGSAASPAIRRSADGTGFRFTTSRILIPLGGTDKFDLSTSHFAMYSTAMVAWSSAADVTSVKDVALSRTSAGVLQINNSVAGNWGALLTGVRDAGTTTLGNGITIGRQSTGTPAAGFGPALLFRAQSSTTDNRETGRIATPWTTATDASRAADMVFSTWLITTEVEVLRLKSNGQAVFGVGSLSIPSISFGDPDTGFLASPSAPTTAVDFVSAGSAKVRFSGGGIRLASAGGVYFSATAEVSGSLDLAYARNAPGVAEINNGTAGIFADLKLQTLTMSGVPRFNGTNSTGAGSALLGTNSPAITLSAPYTWISVTAADGSACFVPAWK